jgi:hypothetical protein
MSKFNLELEEYKNFDWFSYVSYYEDLIKNNINTKEKAWKHWISHGKKEGRQYFDLSEMTKIVSNEVKQIEQSITKPIIPVDENFDWVKYTSYYSDLRDDKIDTKEKAWSHWIKYGEKEGRLYFNINDDDYLNATEYINFDWEMYLQFYNDLQHKKNKQMAWEHWNKYGKSENRIYFDLNQQRIESAPADSQSSGSMTDKDLNDAPEERIEILSDLNDAPEKRVEILSDLNDAPEARIEILSDLNDAPEARIEILSDLNDSLCYNDFEWNNYVNNYEDLKNITTKEEALKHWLTCGINDNRTFLQKNTSKTLFNYKFEDLFFVNLMCHYLSIKNNIQFEYKYNELFEKFGIELFIGKNTYNTDFIVTNDNFFEFINSDTGFVDKNIILSKEIDCIKKEYCLYLKQLFFENNEIQNKITQHNVFKERYLSNKDLYVYIYIINSSDEVYIKQLFEYYNETIKKVKYDKIYISSNNIQHGICKSLTDTYSMVIDDRETCEKIMFANTCKFLILSNDTISLLMGLFNFFSKYTFYPIVSNSKYSDVFQSFGWKGVQLSKINTKPKIQPPPIKKKNQASSPTDEWYDSPFIIPKPVKPITVTEVKPGLKIKLPEDNTKESIHIKFDKFK